MKLKTNTDLKKAMIRFLIKGLRSNATNIRSYQLPHRSVKYGFIVIVVTIPIVQMTLKAKQVGELTDIHQAALWRELGLSDFCIMAFCDPVQKPGPVVTPRTKQANASFTLAKALCSLSWPSPYTHPPLFSRFGKTYLSYFLLCFFNSIHLYTSKTRIQKARLSWQFQATILTHLDEVGKKRLIGRYYDQWLPQAKR